MIADPLDPEYEKQRRLGKLHERTMKAVAEDRWYAAKSFVCEGPGCENVIRKSRVLKQGDGRSFTSMTWCSQECLDKWRAQFHLPGPHWPKYDAEGNLTGYVVPKEHFIPIDDPRLAREER